ncbi:glutamate synthase large subunit [Tichowtungia aerotolerans]|uniref:Glutamate synthase [NADPH] large chain n=1 Tax=Tichowtungia aerotolerans TaxID=2697043 RepID=A0A6P1M3E8_9BACT|nr:glutamate synthase large subunit [Tichowtungia aerotolerans]QHI69369.1 glutamate synthase large subunit [Tichowtungia aerotolerans]
MNKNSTAQPKHFPNPQGLYHPQNEHDACGVGFICNLHGKKSHDIIHHALEILVRLTHRGAAGSDPLTGDGAGILLQIPHAFYKEQCAEIGIKLPGEKEYGTGLVFLPQDEAERAQCIQTLEKAIESEGQTLLGWRELPTDNSGIGHIARKSEPAMMQIFIGRGEGITDERTFDRKLYLIRKTAENAIFHSDMVNKDDFYIPTLTCRIIIYKGLLLPEQMEHYYPDLLDPKFESALALVHQRFSTNTFPAWKLAQPFHVLCHNGEINTLRGNFNWMNARQGLFKSTLFGDNIERLFPIIQPGLSDSASLDQAVELLYHTGRSLPHVMSMLIPEAWQNHKTMSQQEKDYYEYHSTLMEPWDGPASIPFTDGTCLGAILDRNGLRPSRYVVTKDGYVIMGSETGIVDIDPANVEYKGRLEPGRMFLVDMEKGRIVPDEEIKSELAQQQPYGEWLKENLVDLETLPTEKTAPADRETINERQRMFGFTMEDQNHILMSMAKTGTELSGAMGIDTPLAVLAEKPQLLYNYFKQLFAQVTNPPLDAIREKCVTSVRTNIGTEQDLFEETPLHCRQLKLKQPILTNEMLAKIKKLDREGLKAVTLPMLYNVADGGDGLKAALAELCENASKAIKDGCTLLVLSDRGADKEKAPIPALLATGAVHHHLIRKLQRTQAGLVIESGEPREVHHFCLLFGYGAGAINPYMAYETFDSMIQEGLLDGDSATANSNFIKAINKGMLKVMSKMGISTLHSYRGAQIFEAVGINSDVIHHYFTGTASRIEGIGLDDIAKEAEARHKSAFPARKVAGNLKLDIGGAYKWRRNGEEHILSPLAVAKLQEATWTDSVDRYYEYAELINDNSKNLATLRGLFEFDKSAEPVPLSEVEPWTEIVKRFKTGAMSYGSISQETHETLAIGMNRIGGKSNSGEGGEDAERFTPDENGDLRRSAIKQVASGRFGVTSHYLTNADELQIKMAQGAKPGEGGQLPGHKVKPWIAKTRHSTPYVTLISPPPHHDIYSIEDLSQLIYDLKSANPSARINVKLVSEVGVGTVAAGVSKGKADVVLISGYDGGTGASPQASIKHAGLPWELGLAETQQTLVLNNLRSRIRVECDGKLLTGRDVAVAALLGAEEYGFSTAPLITMGCIMLRLCHMNTCSVGVATQDPELRKKFAGKPEYVVNFFRFIAEDLRSIMAELGFRTIDEMVGHSERLNVQKAVAHWKAQGLDYSKILYKPEVDASIGIRCTEKQDHGIDQALDHELIRQSTPALEKGEKVVINVELKNIYRTVGAMLSHEISKKYGAEGLPEDTITINCTGNSGQSFGGFSAHGITFNVKGDANDYFGKGLSGARLIIRPPEASSFKAEENILIGNVAFYGAIKGEAFINGLAGERFCVRNSGAITVVEGIGDHGCEYMTGGRAVILGPTGRNFAAGMSGGIAYVLDEAGDFIQNRCNPEMVNFDPLEKEDLAFLRDRVEKHLALTGSPKAERLLTDWNNTLKKFIKVIPVDYKKALAMLADEQRTGE